MLGKRIIPCLDLKNGRVVKGVNFVDLIDAGDPVETAKMYNDQGADEIVFLDISATNEQRKTMLDVIERAAKEVFIPLTVGGGISSIEDFQAVLNVGADKVSINSAAVNNPKLITEAAQKFGSQCVVVAIDVKKNKDGVYEVVTKGGMFNTHLKAVNWAKKVEELGAGEILLTSMDADGTKAGYDLEITKMISEAVNIPVIASGGAGKKEDFYMALTEGKADAVLAASLFHFGEIKVGELKEYLESKNVPVRKDKMENNQITAKDLKFVNGLIPVITQDIVTGEVLMQAYMNEEAFNKTLETNKVHYFSRSRNQLWLKGETSGHFQELVKMYADCDNDSLLCLVKQTGCACHTGNYSCFFNQIKDSEAKTSYKILFDLEKLVQDRRENPVEGSYTNYLLTKSVDKICKKISEEAGEIIIGSMKRSKEEVIYESADFLYHLTVLLNDQNVSMEEVLTELASRFGAPKKNMKFIKK